MHVLLYSTYGTNVVFFPKLKMFDSFFQSLNDIWDKSYITDEPPPPPKKKKGCFFFLGGGGGSTFLDKITNFWDLVIKKILARILGRPDSIGHFPANYRPISARNPQSKFKNFGIFGYFWENFGTFFWKCQIWPKTAYKRLKMLFNDFSGS